MANALIVGVDGNIGRHLELYLLNLGWQVWGTSRRSGSKSNRFYVDLTNPLTISNIQGEFSVVFLCAALANQQACEDNPTLAKLINLDAQLLLAEECLKYSQNVIFLSTSAVFNGESAFVKTSEQTNPKNVYGEHKSIAERELLNLSSKITILRTSKVITRDLKLLCNWRDQLQNNLTITPFYDLTMCPVPMSQLCNLLALLAEHPLSGIIHISGREDISYYEFALQLADFLKVPASLIQPKSYKEAGIHDSTVYKHTSLDMTETTKIFNLRPVSITDILTENLVSRS